MFTNLLIANGLLGERGHGLPKLRNNVDLGHRFCECYETYRRLVPEPALNFEWGWNLLLNVRRGEELGIARCERCSLCYVLDRLAPPSSACPGCSMFDPPQPASARQPA